MQRFRQFCEAEQQPRLYTYSKERGLRPNESATYAGQIEMLIDSRKIDIEPGSIYSPLVRKGLEELFRQRPDLGHLIVRLDGHEVGTLAQLIGQAHEEFPKYLYHGTSSVIWEKAQVVGLSPRNVTGVSPVFGAHAQIKAAPDKVYFASDDGNDVRFAARAAKRVFKGEAVVLKVEFDKLNFSKLAPDEDSGKSTWQESLHQAGTVAYTGTIKPQIISLHLVLGDNGWEMV